MAGTHAPTAKASSEVALPAATVTATGPLAAPSGMVATIVSAVAEVTAALVPPMATLTAAGSSPNPVPWMVIWSPGTPRSGVTSMIDTTSGSGRSMATMFPTGS